MYSQPGIYNGIYTLGYSISVIFLERDLLKRDIIVRGISLNEILYENSVCLLILQNGVKMRVKIACEGHITATLGYIIRTG